MKRIAHWYQSHIVLILNMTHNLHNRIQTENRTSLFMINNNLRRIKQFAFNEIHNGPYIKQSIFIFQFYCVTQMIGMLKVFFQFHQLHKRTGLSIFISELCSWFTFNEKDSAIISYGNISDGHNVIYKDSKFLL